MIMQTDKPNKKIYTITSLGKTDFLNWLATGNGNFSKGKKDSFLMKIFFSGNITPEESVAMLKKFIADTKKYMDDMKKIPQSIEQYGANLESHHAIYWQFTADFGYSSMQMSIEWAERCIIKLEEIK